MNWAYNEIQNEWIAFISKIWLDVLFSILHVHVLRVFTRSLVLYIRYLDVSFGFDSVACHTFQLNSFKKIHIHFGAIFVYYWTKNLFSGSIIFFLGIHGNWFGYVWKRFQKYKFHFACAERGFWMRLCHSHQIHDRQCCCRCVWVCAGRAEKWWKKN